MNFWEIYISFAERAESNPTLQQKYYFTGEDYQAGTQKEAKKAENKAEFVYMVRSKRNNVEYFEHQNS